MALFGRQRDIDFMVGVNRELLNDIVEQQIDYYKPYLPGTKSKDAENLYGEASAQKSYYRPVRLNCLITYEADTPIEDTSLLDFNRPVTYAFLRDDLTPIQLVCELGDIIEYRGKYFEVDDINEGQFVMGKDRSHPKSVGTDFGRSISIICVTHQTNQQRLQIAKARL
jgi:hypothetical protein